MPLDLSAVDHLVQALARQQQQTAEATPQPTASIGVAPYAALIGGHAFDAGATVDGWRRGLRETNPLIGDSHSKLLAAKAGGALLTSLGMRWLDKRGHDKLAKFIGYGGGIYSGAQGARNLTLGRDK